MADETQQSAVLAPPPVTPKVPWVVIGGVLLAAWWWEKRFKGKSVAGAAADILMSDDEDEETEEEDVSWTDEPVGEGRTKRKRAQLSDIGGPITDTYIAPIKLATNGDCEEAVKLLDKASRQGTQVAERKKQVVRRALRRSADIVTERCPKEVEELIGVTEELQEEVAVETDSLRRPDARREFRRNWTKEITDVVEPVRRTRGEAGRFKRRSGEAELEYRREGTTGWRVLDLHTGKVSRKKIPTGRPRGRPKKLL